MPINPQHSPLAHNLRFLRKKFGLSQTALAEKLGIRRSNVAAYESKNVEPRLHIILDIANHFEIDVRTLIETPLNEDNWISRSSDDQSNQPAQGRTLSFKTNTEIQDFVEKSVKIHKVLEGFKAFYRFKKDKLSAENVEESEINHDIENFISLMEHLLHYNESLIKALTADPLTSSESEGDTEKSSNSSK